MVLADPAIAVSIIRNILANAAEYALPATLIHVRIAARAGITELIVSNEAAALDTADVPHLFEPFWRKDASRNDASHSGVGLALVEAYVRLLGAQVRAELSESRVLSIIVQWPKGNAYGSEAAIPEAISAAVG